MTDGAVTAGMFDRAARDDGYSPFQMEQGRAGGAAAFEGRRH